MPELAEIESNSLAEVSVSDEIREAELAALAKLNAISGLAQVEVPAAATAAAPVEAELAEETVPEDKENIEAEAQAEPVVEEAEA